MLAKSLKSVALTTKSFRPFSYDVREIKLLELEFKRKMNVLKMATDQKEFNYE
jgi:hypothetical protein